jgi:hypothetical protein
MRLPSVVLLVFAFTANVCAQSASGSLVGTVTDTSGAVIPGVSVVAKDTGTNYSRSATTNENGVYTISNLMPGEYLVEFRKEQFKAEHATVELRVNETRRVNGSLEVGAITDVIVNVQAGTSQLQTDTSSISGIVDRGQILRLPSNGRQIDNYVQLLVGASASAPGSHLSSRGGMNVDGVDEHYISFFIDGFDNVDPVIRNFSLRPSLDGVQELRVEQSGYVAEFGRNGGAVVNVITRSGTNDWHWSLWEFFRNARLDARNFFAITPEKPPLIRNQFGGTLGGPIKRDKTFFFVSYEGLRQKVGQVHRATVPTSLMRGGDLSEISGPKLLPSEIHPIAAEVMKAYPLPNLPGTVLNRIEVANRIENDNNFSGRIDHLWSANTRLMARYSGSVAHVIDPFRTETGGSVNLSNFGQTADRFKTNVGVSIVTAFRPSVVHEFRVGFNRFRQPQLPQNPGSAVLEPLMGFVKTFPIFGIQDYEQLGSGSEFRRADNVYNYIDNVSYVRGNHQFKFGVDARRYLFNGYNAPPNIFSFQGARTGRPLEDFLRGLPSAVVSFNGSPGGNTRKFEFASYVQDDWKAGGRLTFNYGIRWEYYGRMTERVNKQSFWVPDCNCMKIAGLDARPGLVDEDFNNFAPRFGFAWRPKGERVVIRASGGIFYDNDMRHNTEVFTNPPFFRADQFLFFAPGGSSLTLSNPFPSAANLATRRPNTFDKHFRDTYIEQWDLNVQYQVAQDLLASVSYVGNHSVKGRRGRDVNQKLNGVTPYPEFGMISLFEQAGSSNYNAFQFQLDRRFSHGFGFTSSYTWGHAIDDRPGQGSGFSQDYYNMRAERGDSDFDVRHTWVATGTYLLPFWNGKSWGGWSVNAISTAQSGRPFTVTTTLPSVTFSGQRPDAAPGVNWRPANQGPDRWINTIAFNKPAGQFGTLGRNTLRGPGLYNLDVSLVKTHTIGEGHLEFRAEFFNVLNHPNFGLPTAVMGQSLGKIATTSLPERQIQFGFKVGF